MTYPLIFAFSNGIPTEVVDLIRLFAFFHIGSTPSGKANLDSLFYLIVLGVLP